jgi:phytanoyl-CoA hydroxylase
MASTRAFTVSDEHRACFRDNGFVRLDGFLSADEVDEVQGVVQRFVDREIAVPGKDYCDMAGESGRRPEDYRLVNVMLPSRYYPEWPSAFRLRAARAAHDLYNDPDLALVFDYDQILCKRGRQPDAVFAWHQDLAYWPADTPDTRTATFWLAVDDATEENGCMRFVPGSVRERQLRRHAPVLGDRGTSHALGCALLPSDEVVAAPVPRGSVTVHNEHVVHGSGGNRSDGPRRAYVICFRPEDTVRVERERGFTHSHNDADQVLNAVGVQGESR